MMSWLGKMRAIKVSDKVHRRKDENRKKCMNIDIARERRRDYDERNTHAAAACKNGANIFLSFRTVFVHFSTCSSARAEKMFPAMGIVIVDVATVKDAAKHTAVFVVNLKENFPSFSFSLFSFVVLKLLLLLDDDEADGFVFLSSIIVQQHLREGCRFSTFRALVLLLFMRRTVVLVVESVVVVMWSFLFLLFSCR